MQRSNVEVECAKMLFQFSANSPCGWWCLYHHRGRRSVSPAAQTAREQLWSTLHIYTSKSFTNKLIHTFVLLAIHAARRALTNSTLLKILPRIAWWRGRNLGPSSSPAWLWYRRPPDHPIIFPVSLLLPALSTPQRAIPNSGMGSINYSVLSLLWARFPLLP